MVEGRFLVSDILDLPLPPYQGSHASDHLIYHYGAPAAAPAAPETT
jgi:hypothetical protein